MLRIVYISVIFSSYFFVVVLSFNSIRIENVFKASHYKLMSSAVEASHSNPNIVAIMPRESLSYFSIKPTGVRVPWMDVMSHISERIRWENNTLQMSVIPVEEMGTELPGDIVLLIGINDLSFKSKVVASVMNAKSVVAFDCSKEYSEIDRFGSYNPQNKSPLDSTLAVIENFLKLPVAKERKISETISDLWNRRSSGDILFLSLMLIDGFSTPVPSVESVTSTANTGLDQFVCMCTKCSDELTTCLSDPLCKKALDCLNSCRGNDQVCQYRCITSYESEKFQNFALCILQKNNCMGNSASIPTFPDPKPLSIFRAAPLSFDVAEAIFEGHLDFPAAQLLTLPQKRLPWSWKVVCGQNPAYDYFSCQHQIFYKEFGRSNVWYDPVFKVETIGGEEVWRRRHYRVRRGKSPGQFYFSVLDNGVVSNEFWRIVDCADDLSWAVFYYSGAASAAGTSYTGALLVTPDGSWPDMTPDTSSRIAAAMDAGGIKMWELYPVNNVDNGKAGPPPLGIPKAAGAVTETA